MKNLRKCNACGADIFEIVPTDNLLGLRFCKTVEIKPWLLRENEYWCKECYEKHLSQKGVPV